MPAFRFKKCVAALVALTGLGGCGHNPLERKLDQPIYYLDNSLAFQPKRIWRLWVKWEPYLLDDKRALVTKEFQFVVRDETERKRVEADIAAKGGDERYLKWLESELVPLGNWEKREQARVARYSDLIVVVLVTKSYKEVPQKGDLTVTPIYFPDTMLRAAADGCHDLDWDVIPARDSLGLEVVFESRSENPGAEKWKRVERELKNFSWKAWSVGQERRIAYRTAIFVKNNMARCPLPPAVHEEFKLITRAQPMGIDW
jgi:hypothetical protein